MVFGCSFGPVGGFDLYRPRIEPVRRTAFRKGFAAGVPLS